MNRVVFRSFLEIQRRRSENPTATSRCSSVVTLQHCDVWSTTVKIKERPNVATFLRFLHYNYKKHKRPNFLDYRETYGREAENDTRATRDIEKTRVFIALFSKPLMIYRTMLVLNSNMF